MPRGRCVMPSGVTVVPDIRDIMPAALVAVACLAATAAHANPCADARPAAGSRVSVSSGCARACASAVAVQLPLLEAGLALCRDRQRADRGLHAAHLSACATQVDALDALLLERARPAVTPAPRWRVPWWAWLAGGLVGGFIAGYSIPDPG